MVKFLNRKVKVTCGPASTPHSFILNSEWLEITKILEVWKDTGCWWNDESEKVFYRVQTGQDGRGGLYELYLDLADTSWHLYKSYD